MKKEWQFAPEPGFSGLELLCCIGIALMLLWFLLVGGNNLSHVMDEGNDDFFVSSAKREALVNLQGATIFTDGVALAEMEYPVKGYYDSRRHTIDRTKPVGYNSQRIVTGKNQEEIFAEPETMAVCVEYDGKEVRAYWVPAKGE